MPYILGDRRPDIDKAISELPSDMTDGDINYAITRLLNRRIEVDGLSYRIVNLLMGVLECVKHEFYRRVAAQYEDQKCIQNGDAYDAQ